VEVDRECSACMDLNEDSEPVKLAVREVLHAPRAAYGIDFVCIKL
jgi:hypothetical protein